MTSTLPATFLKTLKAPHFSGLHTEDVEEWITKAEKYLDLFDIQEEYLRVTNMDDEEAIYAYESGLKSQFQDHFAGNPDQRNNLNNMMRIAESLDQSRHLNVNQQQHNNNNYNNKPRQFPPSHYPQNNNHHQQFPSHHNNQYRQFPSNNNNYNRPRPLNNGIYNNSGPEPMHLDSLQFKQQQKQNDAQNNACFYCHAVGHRTSEKDSKIRVRVRFE
ncbi:hypothetical protein BGZ76_007117 [Entomortierella beljakovae]|nr:hypothetical protein BGZ76_007117 [Entomortierella beljakovae]